MFSNGFPTPGGMPLNKTLSFPKCGIRCFCSSRSLQEGWNRYSTGMVNHQTLHGHCSQRRELGEKMTAFWITPLLAWWIKHVRGPAGATADSTSRLELWEDGASSTLGENGVWLTMARVLLWEQRVKPEQLKRIFTIKRRCRAEELNRMFWHLWKFLQKEWTLRVCCSL